jgi:hypothetical protein
MDLVIAVQQLSAIVDVWRPHCACRFTERDSRRVRLRRDRNTCGAGAEVLIAGQGHTVSSLHSAIPEVDSVASRDAIAEGQQTIPTSQGRLFSFRQHPDADAVAVRNAIRLPVSIQRMRVTGFTPILNIDAEQASP